MWLKMVLFHWKVPSPIHQYAGPSWFKINLVCTRHIYEESWWGGAEDSTLSWAQEPGLWCRCAKLVAQSCPNLCDPMDCSPPGSTVLGIFQARILKWVSISSSRGSSRPRDRTRISCTASRFFTIWAIWDTGGVKVPDHEPVRAHKMWQRGGGWCLTTRHCPGQREPARQLSHSWDGTRGSARASGDLGSSKIWGVQSLWGRGTVQVRWHHPNKSRCAPWANWRNISQGNAQLLGHQHHSPFHLCK